MARDMACITTIPGKRGELPRPSRPPGGQAPPKDVPDARGGPDMARRRTGRGQARHDARGVPYEPLRGRSDAHRGHGGRDHPRQERAPVQALHDTQLHAGATHPRTPRSRRQDVAGHSPRRPTGSCGPLARPWRPAFDGTQSARSGASHLPPCRSPRRGSDRTRRSDSPCRPAREAGSGSRPARRHRR